MRGVNKEEINNIFKKKIVEPLREIERGKALGLNR